MGLFNKKNVKPVFPEKETASSTAALPHKKTNTILRGSSLQGDIQVTCDLELSGDIQGNITSKENSSIRIKGSCKGSIETAGGNVQIEGELVGGNIKAGGDVEVTGRFLGGNIFAGGRCFIDGEFNGKIEAAEIEIGPQAIINGDFYYRENFSVAKGAQITGLMRKEEVASQPMLSIATN
jgi:cytoskeletal protein CcmA (bactofilin family)